jgi:O-antigen biosynthesis protein WbqP
MYRRFFKPLFDFFAALAGLIILSPLFLALAAAIKIDSRGPVFFRQSRIGKNKKLFRIYKFRTMRSDTPRDVPTHLMEDPARHITKVGKFLRRTSLDELPQIINILFGQMSVIGPRPALWNQDDLAAERDKYGANGVRPGLTGLAQVNGRDELEIPVKARLDGDYVNRISLLTDIKIFFMTVAKVFRSDGVVEGGTGALAAQSAGIPLESVTEEAASVRESILADGGENANLEPTADPPVAGGADAESGKDL